MRGRIGYGVQQGYFQPFIITRRRRRRHEETRQLVQSGDHGRIGTIPFYLGVRRQRQHRRPQRDRQRVRGGRPHRRRPRGGGGCRRQHLPVVGPHRRAGMVRGSGITGRRRAAPGPHSRNGRRFQRRLSFNTENGKDRKRSVGCPPDAHDHADLLHVRDRGRRGRRRHYSGERGCGDRPGQGPLCATGPRFRSPVHDARCERGHGRRRSDGGALLSDGDLRVAGRAGWRR